MPTYTAEQIKKCDFDAHTFLTAARLMYCEIRRKGYRRNSMPWVSMMTVIMCNLGMAFELRLKLLLIKTGADVLKSHKLARLFLKLPCSVRSDLQAVYADTSKHQEFAIVAFKSTSTPVPPKGPDDNRPLDAFVQFLEYFDDIGLYAQRYAFESYDGCQWNYYFDPPTPLFDLLGKITKYTTEIG